MQRLPKAEGAGISLSMFIRCAGLSRRIRNQSDRILCADIKTFAAQLRSLGGLQKELFNSSRGAHSQQTSELLIAFKETLIYSKTQLLPPDKSRPPERCRDEKSNKSAPP
ncbi:plasmid mobilization protein [Pseudomonas cannabina]|uniref:plasmid mobilization protein n=1 Tax=Pseudomonas cannabina TaxID=86840 RepID=UPI0008828CC0|nr:hypothetical protein F4W70_30005 [Pseudomonas cannabina]SDR26856.1 hypothetical protein SAMN05216597_3204 [Pseudomonas cannabina]